MKREIFIVSLCILASILIFEVSKNTATRSYPEKTENELIADLSVNENSDSISDNEISDSKTEDIASTDKLNEKDSYEIDFDSGNGLSESSASDVGSGGIIDGSAPKYNSDYTEERNEENISETLSTEAFDGDDPEISDGDETTLEAAEEGDLPSQEKNILVYLDAYKEAHQAEINPAIKMNDYDVSCFQMKDGYMSYEGDDRYTYRVGIDVSHHSGEIDWNAVKKSGIEFAFLRIGYRGYGAEGILKEDKMFRTYIKDAHDAGIDVGVYVFSQAINTIEAEEEAQLVIDILKDYNLELPVVYDPEIVANANARTDYVSGEQFTENAIAFCEKIKSAGYDPMIYCDMVWESDYFDLTLLSDYPIWYSDFEPHPQTPYYFSYWQYSNTGSVPGISGTVDLDIRLMEK